MSSKFDITPLGPERIRALAERLTPEERAVMLLAGTERPFCGVFVDNKKTGTYVCRLCGLPLYSSSTKFNSGTGWPSFFAAYAPTHVRETPDHSHGMARVELTCARCGAHLGHVFPDGPPPSGMRHCINSVSLDFVDEGLPITLR